MLFNSYIFLYVFLPVTLLGWWRLRHTSARLLFLTLASYVFYGWWDWRFVPLMIASTTVDYIAGQKIVAAEDISARKRWLAGSLTFNLAILGFFKYYGFFASSVNIVAERAGMHALIPVLNIVLPVGISFYTFNSMSYTIDIYRGVVRPAKSILHFSAFVAMFPHLVMGPIVRYSDIEHQFADLKTRLSWEQACKGTFFFVVGLGKKLLIADQLSGPVQTYFGDPYGKGMLAAWIGMLGFAFQLYFDFSGYSDMAVGLAHLLGIQFPQNFNSPYKSQSISEVWRRWHMSLSTWLRDYLFVPLGGSRKGTLLTARNLAITMILGGLWHGANWTFVGLGLYYGILLATHHLLATRGWTPDSMVLNRFLAFMSFFFGLVFFPCESLRKAMHVWAALFGADGFAVPHPDPWNLGVILLAFLIANFAPNSWELKIRPRPIFAYAAAVITFFSILLLDKENPFLYFQF